MQRQRPRSATGRNASSPDDSKSGRVLALVKRVTSLEMDRITPTLEPDAPVVMHQDWHHLLFLHWEVPPQELQQLIAPELTIDTRRRRRRRRTSTRRRSSSGPKAAGRRLD